MEIEFLLWLWHGLTDDLIQHGIDSETLRNSIGHKQYDTIRHYRQQKDYADDNQ
jgi:hypothetical protein